MVKPPFLGAGNWKRRNRRMIHISTAELPVVEFLVLVELTEPSLAMTNFTVKSDD